LQGTTVARKQRGKSCLKSRPKGDTGEVRQRRLASARNCLTTKAKIGEQKALNTNSAKSKKQALSVLTRARPIL